MIDLRKTGIPVVALGLLVACSQNPPAQSASQATAPTPGYQADSAQTAAGSTTEEPAGTMGTGPAPNSTPTGTAPAESGTTSSADTATPTNTAPKDALTDEQIAAITSLANNTEIEQAKLARARSKNEQVLQFAGMMIAHHGDAQRKQDAMSIGTAESTLSRTMSVEGNETLKQLKEKTGAEFDRAYLKSQVDAHQKVLSTLENQLIPNAKREDLKALLSELRPRLKQHLEQAERAMATMASRSAPGATPSVAAQ